MDNNFNSNDIKNQIDREYQEYLNSIKKTNILVLGQTGVGKSSLVNLVFGEELAKVSNVKPETRGFHIFSSDNLPINIVDSQGYELENSSEFKTNLKEFIDSKFTNVTEQIHLAWYCINVTSARVLPFDIENIKFLIDVLRIPTAVVFTQCDQDDEEGGTAAALTKVIESNFSRKVKTFQVSNNKNLKLELNDLIDWSVQNISDDNVKVAFVLSQKANLKIKNNIAHEYIVKAAVSAAAIGATPIPIADSTALFVLQIGLAYKIFNIYGINQNIAKIVNNALGTRIMSTVGKTLAGSLIKFIPGVGTITGSLINASVASSLTYALGYALSKMAEKAYLQILEGKTNGNIEEILKHVITEENLEKFLKAFKIKKNNA